MKEWQVELLFIMNIIFTTSTNHEDINKLICTREQLTLLFYSGVSQGTFLVRGQHLQGGDTRGKQRPRQCHRQQRIRSGSLRRPHLTKKGDALKKELAGGNFSKYVMKTEHGGYLTQSPPPPFSREEISYVIDLCHCFGLPISILSFDSS